MSDLKTAIDEAFEAEIKKQIRDATINNMQRNIAAFEEMISRRGQDEKLWPTMTLEQLSRSRAIYHSVAVDVLGSLEIVKNAQMEEIYRRARDAVTKIDMFIARRKSASVN